MGVKYAFREFECSSFIILFPSFRLLYIVAILDYYLFFFLPTYEGLLVQVSAYVCLCICMLVLGIWWGGGGEILVVSFTQLVCHFKGSKRIEKEKRATASLHELMLRPTGLHIFFFVFVFVFVSIYTCDAFRG